jgi:hypothetical protein
VTGQVVLRISYDVFGYFRGRSYCGRQHHNHTKVGCNRNDQGRFESSDLLRFLAGYLANILLD